MKSTACARTILLLAAAVVHSASGVEEQGLERGVNERQFSISDQAIGGQSSREERNAISVFYSSPKADGLGLLLREPSANTRHETAGALYQVSERLVSLRGNLARALEDKKASDNTAVFISIALVVLAVIVVVVAGAVKRCNSNNGVPPMYNGSHYGSQPQQIGSYHGSQHGSQHGSYNQMNNGSFHSYHSQTSSYSNGGGIPVNPNLSGSSFGSGFSASGRAITGFSSPPAYAVSSKPASYFQSRG